MVAVTGGVAFLTLDVFCGVLGNKHFPLDPVLKENLCFFIACWCLGGLFYVWCNRCLFYVRGRGSFYTFLNLGYVGQKLLRRPYR